MGLLRLLSPAGLRNSRRTAVWAGRPAILGHLRFQLTPNWGPDRSVWSRKTTAKGDTDVANGRGCLGRCTRAGRGQTYIRAHRRLVEPARRRDPSKPHRMDWRPP